MSEADHQNYDPGGRVRAIIVLLGVVALASIFLIETIMGFRLKVPIAMFIGFLIIADYKGVFLRRDVYAWAAGILALLLLFFGFVIGQRIEIGRGQELAAYVFGAGFLCWGAFAIAERIWPSISRKAKIKD